MDTVNTEMKKNNSIIQTLILPFYTILNIIVFALKGFKALFYDLWIIVFNSLSYRLDRIYQVAKDPSFNENDDIYERTKKMKKKKVYHYSDKTLANLEKKKAELLEDLQKAGATRSKEPHIYLFKVKDTRNGRIFTGTMPGFSKLDINSFLLNEGYEVYSITTNSWLDMLYHKTSFFGNRRMNTKDLIFWLTQLATYLKAGLTLNDSIKILTSQIKGDSSRERAFQSISYELTLGEPFSVALEKQGDMFPALLINMIKAAEASGTLIETLEDMADYYTEVNTTKKEMISAMTYPAIITVFALGVVTFILIYVVPKFTKIYDNFGAEINGFTQFIIDASQFLKNNIVLILLIIFLIVLVIIIMYRSIKLFRTYFQVLLMHIPIVKNVIIYKELTIFSKTFASLLKNNVFITESVGILSKITNNEIYKAILYRTINNIIKGEKISEAFADHWAIPDVAYFMIVTGESTGRLAEMMQKVSEYYQEMHRSIVNNLKAFIEPIMISFLAVVVGGIIIAVIVPMFNIYSMIQ